MGHLLNRCFNMAMTPEKDIYFIVGKGEVRWECKLSDGETEELKKYGLQLEDTFVHCPSLADGDCMAGYKLNKIPGDGNEMTHNLLESYNI